MAKTVKAPKAKAKPVKGKRKASEASRTRERRK